MMQEWEFEATVSGTVWAEDAEQARKEAEMALYGIGFTVDVESIEATDEPD